MQEKHHARQIQWIDSDEDDPNTLNKLQGCSALVLTYFAWPHRTLILGLKGGTPDDVFFMVLFSCRQMEMPADWTVSAFQLERVDFQKNKLSDTKAGVRIHFGVGRLFERAEAKHYFRGNPELIRMFDQFHDG